jgi:hypothetical protein
MRPKTEQRRETYACDICGAPFSGRVYERERGRARACSHSCAGQIKHNTGTSRADLAEVLVLMYPFMRTRELAEFTGLPYLAITKFAVRRRLRKDPGHMRSIGQRTTGPEDPELRAVWAAQVALKGAITKRSKELQCPTTST